MSNCNNWHTWVNHDPGILLASVIHIKCSNCELTEMINYSDINDILEKRTQFEKSDEYAYLNCKKNHVHSLGVCK